MRLSPVKSVSGLNPASVLDFPQARARAFKSRPSVLQFRLESGDLTTFRARVFVPDRWSGLVTVTLTGPSAAVALTVTVASLATAVFTFRPTSIQEPRYEGLLVNAPAVVGEAHAGRQAALGGRVQKIVTHVGEVRARRPKPFGDGDCLVQGKMRRMRTLA